MPPMSLVPTHCIDSSHLPDPVLAIDGDARITNANGAACEALGADERELIGVRLHARVAEPDRRALTLLLARGRQGQVGEEVLTVRSDSAGSVRRYLARVLPAHAADVSAGDAETASTTKTVVTLVMRDLTQLDRLGEESRRRSHLERTPGQFMLSLDSAGRIEHAVGMDGVLGYAPRAWIGHPFGELLEDAATRAALLETMRRDIDEGGRWTALEQCVRSDGTSILVQLFATARVDAVSHAPVGFYLSGLVSAPLRETTVVGVTTAGARARERDSRRHTPIATARVSQPVQRSMAGESRIVLVADDDPTMRAVVRHLLERGGYDVVETSSGREALDVLRNGTPARFLVADLRMADGSGGWLVSQVGYEFPALVPRTVVISGDASSAAAAHVTARWRCPVLAKPFNGAQLLHALDSLGERAADVA